MTPPPLFQRFPALAAAVPWTRILSAPTPVETLSRLADRCGLKRLYVKREDATHDIAGGNKVRGLEFLLADALQRKADTLVTFGAAGSNHVAATAHHGRELGFKTTAFVMAQPPAAYVPCNLAIDIAAGATLIPVNPLTAAPRLLIEWVRMRRRHTRARWIPPGGTTPLSCLGHVNAALELRAQIDAGLLPAPDHLIVGLGSLGTAAGLLLGCRLAGLPTQIVGVVVFSRLFCTARRCAALARRTLRFMQRRDPSVPNVDIRADDVAIVGTSLGKGYAHATPESAALASDMAAADELQLDAAYTSKALSGGLNWAARHAHRDANILYWHTYHAKPRPTAEQLQHLEAALPPALRRYLICP